MRGEQVAFAALFERHSGAVRTAVRGHIGRSSEAVEDAVQESFARALSGIDSLRDPTRFRPWLMQIARNVATDIRRRDGRAVHDPIDETGDGDEGTVLVGEGRGPDIEAELTEMASLVRGCVAGLAPRDATAISMVMWLGFRPPDVAVALGITTGAAKVLLHRARNRLRDAIVLEVAASARRFSCPELVALISAQDDVGAARHLKSCDACTESGRAHVGLSPRRVETAAEA